MSDDREALAQTRRELRREVGPSGVGDGDWQPMVAASELWRLLDALDENDEALANVWDEGWQAGRQRVVGGQSKPNPYRDAEPRCQHVSPTPWGPMPPWGPTQCALAAGHDGRHAYSPSETL